MCDKIKGETNVGKYKPKNLITLNVNRLNNPRKRKNGKMG